MHPNIFGYGTGDIGASYARSKAGSAETAAQTARRDVASLEERLDKLSLVCMAMWSLLQDKAGVTEEQLLERVRTIDLMDGVEDGKATRTISKCPQCQRVMSPRHRKCLYCGSERLVQSAFDAL